MVERRGWMERAVVPFMVVMACVGCDQASKHVAARHLVESGPISFWGDMLRFQYVENAGAFLSLGSGLAPGARFVLFGLFVAAVLAALAVKVLRDRALDAGEMIAATLIMGGGASNLIDRLSLGAVRDFVSVGLGRLRTGVFNAADLFVMGGIFLLMASTWRGGRRQQ